MKYFDSWIPTCLMFGGVSFTAITAIIWNPIGPTLGLLILIGTVLSGLFHPKSNNEIQNLRDEK